MQLFNMKVIDLKRTFVIKSIVQCTEKGGLEKKKEEAGAVGHLLGHDGHSKDLLTVILRIALMCIRCDENTSVHKKVNYTNILKGSIPGLVSGICGGQSGAGAGFLRVLRFPLPFIPPNSPSAQSPGAGTIGQ
jgi:hypothetical protein